MGGIINLIPVSLALATAFSWVFGQVLGKLVVRDLNSTIFNTIRFSIAAIMLTPFVLITGIELAGTWPTILAIINGVFGMAVSLQIYFYCMKRAPAHRVVTIGNASSVWTVLLALFFLGEGITALLPFSLALVVFGSLLLVPRKEEPNNWGPAVPLAMVVSFLWALDQVLRKAAVNSGMEPLTFICISVVSATVLLNLATVVTRSWRGQRFSRMSLGLSLASALFANLIGTFLYMLALGMENVSSLTPFISASIPIGFLLSILIVRERPNLKAVIGMILVFFGVVLAAI